MSESKGRTGKKPKYQIADIGGADLTSEDISTERVLNFLIKGDLGTAAETVAPTVDNRKPEPPLPSVSESHSTTLSEIGEVPAGNQPIKKSLSHLFERAGGGNTPAASKEASVKSERPTTTVEVNSSDSQPIDHEALSESVVAVGTPHVEIGAERTALSSNPQTDVREPEIEPGPLASPQPSSDSLPVSTELESQLTEFVE